MPQGLDFEIVTCLFEKIVCCIDNKYLIKDINYISKNYTNKYMGKWTVIGIFDNVSFNSNAYKYTSGEEFKKGIDDVENSLLSLLYPCDSNKFVLKPIIIYRTLNY